MGRSLRSMAMNRTTKDDTSLSHAPTFASPTQPSEKKLPRGKAGWVDASMVQLPPPAVWMHGHQGKGERMKQAWTVPEMCFTCSKGPWKKEAGCDHGSWDWPSTQTTAAWNLRQRCSSACEASDEADTPMSTESPSQSP